MEGEIAFLTAVFRGSGAGRGWFAELAGPGRIYVGGGSKVFCFFIGICVGCGYAFHVFPGTSRVTVAQGCEAECCCSAGFLLVRVCFRRCYWGSQSGY